jgi:hypothetical protein
LAAVRSVDAGAIAHKTADAALARIATSDGEVRADPQAIARAISAARVEALRRLVKRAADEAGNNQDNQLFLHEQLAVKSNK